MQTYRCALLLTLGLAVGGANTGAATITFQFGAPGTSTHSVTDDTWNTQGSGNFDGRDDLATNGSPEAYTLVRFPELFGVDLDQVPLGSVITSATLTIRTKAESSTQASALTFDVHRVLATWDESSVTFANFDGGGSPVAGSAYDAVVLASFVPDTLGAANVLDVTAAVANWSAGGTNLGLLIRTSSAASDIAIFHSEKASVATDRPQLIVTFSESVPEPGALSVVAIACALTGVQAQRLRRQ